MPSKVAQADNYIPHALSVKQKLDDYSVDSIN